MKLFDFLKKKPMVEKAPSDHIEPKVEEKPQSGFTQDKTTMTLTEALNRFKPDFTPGQRAMSQRKLRDTILYAVAFGDIAGSQYEGVPYPGSSIADMMKAAKDNEDADDAYPTYDGYKTIDLLTEFNHITDDTILTIAIYKASQKIKALGLTNEKEIVDLYTKYLRKYHHQYPNAGYAGGFDEWALSETEERSFSYGNGACMRVGGIAVLFDDLEDVITYAYYSALPSHSHAEGIKGAVCTAVIYWMLSRNASKNDVIRYLEKHYPNDGSYKIHAHTQIADLVAMNRVNPWSTVSVISQTSLVEAVINFMESDSLESCIRNSYRYLCDRDTIAAISAPMAAIFYNDLRMQGWNGEEIISKYIPEKLLEDINN